MLTHIIYHIPGYKVGCTRDFGRRRREYPQDTEMVVIEELYDKSNNEAGDIEWKWAEKLGYNKGPHYTQVLELTKLSRLTIDDRRKNGNKGGLATAAKKTVSEHKEWASEQGKKRAGSKHTEVTKKKMSAAKKGAKWSEAKRLAFENKLKSRLKCQCPHCGKESWSLTILYRWHFDRCPNKV